MTEKQLKRVLIIGSGPIVIGQAAEFDYSGSQACRSLREEGVFTILINSNPATIMTDEGIADRIYIEPLNVEVVARIIEEERPDGILATLGGQTGLNLAVELADSGVLEKYDVSLLGTPLETIRVAEDRLEFRNLLLAMGEPVPPGATVDSLEQADLVAGDIGLPVVIRPAYTLGGTGGGIAKTREELLNVVQSGISASPINQVLIEKSLEGWKELEYEVIRDASDTCITVCNMENLDPMGVHTGDSIVVAPSQTLTDKEYQMLRSASLRIIRALGIEGGCNVQFALPPSSEVRQIIGDVQGEIVDPYYVIEVNPRVSRSSALASKATGYPIARVAAKIAVGRTLDSISNAVTGQTIAAFEPALDYCVVKIPRWPFDKFATGDRRLGTQMKATGEVMAIERTFEAAVQKAVRSLEFDNRSLLWEDQQWISDSKFDDSYWGPSDIRLWSIASALRRGFTPEQVTEETLVDLWFTRALSRIIEMEAKIPELIKDSDGFRRVKRMGFSDEQIAEIAHKDWAEVRQLRKSLGVTPVYKMVDTCAAEFDARTPYFYSTYEQENEAESLPGAKALVLGSGPIRIGQGIEFDYCSVHAAWALQGENVASIMVNSNPETVSTDFDTSSRLYFEPLDIESVLDILDNEKMESPDKEVYPPSVVQFGGQTAINLSQQLDAIKMPILGSSAEAIDIASDRERFEEFLKDADLPSPPGSTVETIEQALNVAKNLGYPVLVRPSYVLGGRAMEIVQNPTELMSYLESAFFAGEGRSLLIDKYLEGKEVEVDAICDGDDVLIPGIMEHIERAGVHSGDSMAIYPGLTLTQEEIDTLVDYTVRIARGLQLKGLMNIQYVIMGGAKHNSPDFPNYAGDPHRVFILEVNPRGSRTVPFLSKVTGVPMVQLATKIMLGRTLSEMGYESGLWDTTGLVAVKAPVFSMSKLTGVDTYLGPEMKSTGEVMGVDDNFHGAVSKALTASGMSFPTKGSVLITIADGDKPDSVSLIRDLAENGYELYATEGTAKLIAALGYEAVLTYKKIDQGHPNILDAVVQGDVEAVINTVSGERGPLSDGFDIRRAATERRIPCFTSIDTAKAAVASATQSVSIQQVLPVGSYRSKK